MCVLIFYIGIIFLYSYRSPVSVLFSSIVIYDSDIYYAYYLACYYLTPDSCMLSPDICLIPLITCHMIYHHLTCDYHISGILSCHYMTPDSCMLSPDTCLISLITCHLIYYHLTCDYHISRILSCYPILYTVTCISSTFVLLLLLNS